MPYRHIPTGVSRTQTAAVAEIVKSAICRTSASNIHHGVARPLPTTFFFPGLNSRPLYHATDFSACTQALQKNHACIVDEYHQLRREGSNDYNISGDEHKLHVGDWEWNSYVLKGTRQTDFAVQCPHTVDVLESLSAPRLMTGTPFSYTFFSTLKANSSISKHYGPCNLRVRCHYPLIVPKDSGFGMRVGNEVVKWEEGQPVYFDDCYEHEVWNNTSEDRVVLLFDLWHPELTEIEINAIIDMFQYARQQGWLKSSEKA